MVKLISGNRSYLCIDESILSKNSIAVDFSRLYVFLRLSFRWPKFSVGPNFRYFWKLSSLSTDIVLADNVYIIFKFRVVNVELVEQYQKIQVAFLLKEFTHLQLLFAYNLKY